jgi:hypothetical protein
VKTYHWQTKSHARHKASDELATKFGKLMDDFVETYYGKYDSRPLFSDDDIITLENCDDTKAVQNLRDFAKYLTTDLDNLIKDDLDLQNIRDEILAAVHHALYLYSFT